MRLTSKPNNRAFLDYQSRTPEYYLLAIAPDVLASLQPEQLAEFKRVLDDAVPRPAPKLVDLRFVIDLVFSRFYVVLFIGKDRRRKQRQYALTPITRAGNAIVAIVILIAMNLTISVFILLAVYLVKSAVGIDLLPNHFPDAVKQLFHPL